MNPSDTIVAISSASGAAARMIVRLAGPNALTLAAALTSDVLPASTATLTRLAFADLTVPATLYAFRAPRSYTGDDLIEFHLPGNPLLARLLLDHLTAAGARPADPGEFTARAYFNGRLDLAEAEGVAATIAASNERDLSAARQLLAGELSRRLRPAIDLVAQTLALVEAGIDFADEGISFVGHDEVLARVDRVDGILDALLSESSRFEPLAHEPVVVLIGRPNAGKSTLLNALAGRERAVVSPVAGTTRDALSVEIAVPGGMVRLIDVAGVEHGEKVRGEGPAAEVERQMADRALRAAEEADVLILVHDATDARPPVATPRPPDLVVRTKIDLSGDLRSPGQAEAPAEPRLPSRAHASARPTAVSDERKPCAALHVSAVTRAGLAELRTALGRLAFGDASAGGASLALNARHVRCVTDAREALAGARGSAKAREGAEFIAHHLRGALDALGAVLGAVSPDDLLGRIFSSFCIGK